MVIETALILSTVGTPTTMEPLALLRATAENYQTLRSYEFDGRLRGEIPGAPGQFVVEVSTGAAGGEFVPSSFPVPSIPEGRWFRSWHGVGAAGERLPGHPEGFPDEMPSGWGFYDRMAVRVQAARRIAQESLVVGGLPVECDVLEVDYGPSRQRPQTGSVRYWIDPRRLVVIQQTFRDTKSTAPVEWTYTVTSLKLNQSPPDWLWAMAKSMRAGEERSQWAGRDAPAFGLPDLQGRIVALSAFKGKVLVLNLWATWCGPCKEEMESLEKLRADYSSKGVEVLGVTDEEPEVAQEWLSRNRRSLPTLTDPKRSLFDEYGVDQIPVVVVIGRDGKVVRFFVGLHRESDLRAAVEAAVGERFSK
jgi:peroxiredoxin